ncbi:DUF445 domain-containing protein [Magnetospirillum sp. UT-4]|uniref:DUF445 domain-containing protein n=1 Tax=Magnetospirillum sp. UT-4 TaxID=2681467 RepID=UPI00138417CF|nr:DUF445 domain-containing protein [Magnetospirillum sp. UT-4]CAA7614087.1 Creatinine amidohydrolase [Magnetospirillum sp. UT-4]
MTPIPEMAPAPANSKHDERSAQYRRMKRLATGLLLAMAVVFVAALLAQRRFDWPWLPFLRAFAEAAMIGAIADWFAVVALFRRPFGLPIPHTAIIPRNKDRIGESLGAFICNNFLAPELVAARLDALDPAGRAAAWLADPANAGAVARRGAAWLPTILAGLEDEGLARVLKASLGRGVAAVDAAPLAGRVLALMVARGRHQALLDRAVELAEDVLLANHDLIRARVAERVWRWLPRWVDRKLADTILVGLLETLGELRDPDHPWRATVQAAILDFALRLDTDPALRARVAEVKAEIAASPLLDDYLNSLWSEMKARLHADLARHDGDLSRWLEAAVAGLGRRLAADAVLRATLNRWLRRVVERNVVPYRGEIGGFIAGVVRRWDTRTLVAKLELQVGRDLQYIRINGTIVGGLAGLALYSVARLLG